MLVDADIYTGLNALVPSLIGTSWYIQKAVFRLVLERNAETSVHVFVSVARHSRTGLHVNHIRTVTEPLNQRGAGSRPGVGKYESDSSVLAHSRQCYGEPGVSFP